MEKTEINQAAEIEKSIRKKPWGKPEGGSPAVKTGREPENGEAQESLWEAG